MSPLPNHQGLPLEGLRSIAPGKGLNLLDGIRVVDLTTSIAGPYAGMLLADFGAEVIKIERPAGDDARSWGPPFLNEESLWFLAVNRNKKSVVLDLNDAQGKSDLYDLIRSASVVLANHPPRIQKKLGLDYETVSGINRSIVFASITGFGLNGDRADLPCYDLIAEGYSGIMDLTGDADGDPQKIGAPAADMLAGQDTAMAVMAAIVDQTRTGNGHLIDVSLVESMTRFLTCRLSSFIGSGDLPSRSGGKDSVIAIYQSFETKDLPITLGLGSDGIWRRFWAALGQPDYADNPDMASNADRRKLRTEIVQKIQELLLAETQAHWLEVFEQARVPAGPINDVYQVISDPALADRGFIAALNENGEVTPHIGLGIQFDGEPVMPRSGAPKLGQHTEEVLNKLRSDAATSGEKIVSKLNRTNG